MAPARPPAAAPHAAGRVLYVYYKVAEPGLSAALAAARAMQAALATAHPGLVTGLLRRPESRDGQVTLMETYAGGDPVAWAGALLAASQALTQPRHCEWFDPIT